MAKPKKPQPALARPKQTPPELPVIDEIIDDAELGEDLLDDDILAVEEPAAAPPLSGLITVVIPEDGDLERLDRSLARALPGLSRSRLKALIEQRQVSSDGATVSDPSLRVKPGQSFAINLPEPIAAEPVPQHVDFGIVYEDEHLIVIDKPAGLVVHPAPGSYDRTLVNGLLAHCGASLSGIGGVRRPGIVHRIDKDTSGLLVVAKTDVAHARLSAQFADHSITRSYRAIVRGVPMPSEDTIEGAIGRDPGDRKRMAVVTKGGKEAITHYRVLRRFGDKGAAGRWKGLGIAGLAAEVECQLETGRTHQIRVHLTHRGHPLLGDPVYGRGVRRRAGLAGPGNAAVSHALEGFGRQALHAQSLGFVHPITREEMEFESPLPDDMLALIDRLDTL